MPGLTRCARCRAMLVWVEPVVSEDIAPPRAGRSKRLRLGFYAVRRRLSRHRLWPAIGNLFSRKKQKTRKNRPKPSRSTNWWRSQVLPTVFRALLPGGGYWVRKRWRATLLSFLVWLFLLAGAAFFAGNEIGYILVALAIAWHFGTALHAAVIAAGPQLIQTSLRFWGFVSGYTAMNLVCLYLVGLIFLRSFVSFYRTPVASPALDIRINDVLLIRRRPPRDVQFGDVVLVRLPRDRARAWSSDVQSPAVLLALLGDTIEVRKDKWVRNGKMLDVSTIVGENLTAGLTDGYGRYTPAQGQAVVLIPLQLRRDRWRVGGSLRIRQVSLSDFTGRATMVYQPVSRRHMLRKVADSNKGK